MTGYFEKKKLKILLFFNHILSYFSYSQRVDLGGDPEMMNGVIKASEHEEAVIPRFDLEAADTESVCGTRRQTPSCRGLERVLTGRQCALLTGDNRLLTSATHHAVGLRERLTALLSDASLCV